MSRALDLRGVVKRYRSFRALDGLDLQVPAGSVFGLVGSNGAGKTTALGAVAGLLRIHGGTIDVLGEGPFSPDRHRGRVSLLPQDAHPPPHARLDELLTYYGRLQGVEPGTLRRDVDRVLDMVHLSDRRRDRVRTLSHGMRRRLTIAQAFLGNPELVLLDEPMNGLDPREVAALRGVLRDGRGTRTLVVSSHLLTELEAICDQVAIIERGRRVRQDPLQRLTRTDRQLVFHIVPGTVPLDPVRQVLPGTTVQLSDDGRTLTVHLPADGIEPADANARLLPVLLEAGVRILEVRRGSDLEREYLAENQAPG